MLESKLHTGAGPILKRQDRRRHQRVRTLLTGSLVDGDRSVDGVVLDMSVAGARVQTAEPIGHGARLRIKIARLGEFTGQVVWRSDNKVGVRFKEKPYEIARALSGFLPQHCLAS